MSPESLEIVVPIHRGLGVRVAGTNLAGFYDCLLLFLGGSSIRSPVTDPPRARGTRRSLDNAIVYDLGDIMRHTMMLL